MKKTCVMEVPEGDAKSFVKSVKEGRLSLLFLEAFSAVRKYQTRLV